MEPTHQNPCVICYEFETFWKTCNNGEETQFLADFRSKSFFFIFIIFYAGARLHACHFFKFLK